MPAMAITEIIAVEIKVRRIAERADFFKLSIRGLFAEFGKNANQYTQNGKESV